MSPPTISAVVRAYNAEEHIGQALTSILSQTRPPDEVLVVDDGSTDGTPGVLERFRGDVRVARQANGGHAAAFNRGFAEARSEYVANCDADDVWEPDKLERQAETLIAHPEVDFAFGGARFFGLTEGPRAAYPDEGVLDREALAGRLYRANFICTSTTLVRRSLHSRVGQFRREAAPCEDYDYWLRAASAGAVFFHDPSCLVRYRTHSRQSSQDLLRMHRQEHLVHRWNAGLVGDTRLARKTQARDLSNIARELSDQGRSREARAEFVSSLRQRPSLRVLVWVMVLSAPDRCRNPLADGLVSIKRSLSSAAQR